MGIYLEGFKPPNDKFRKMKAVWDACTAAGIDIPDEVRCFFHDEAPDDNGVKVNLVVSGKMDERDGVVTPYTAEMIEGFDVNLDRLDKDVRVLRFRYVD